MPAYESLVNALTGGDREPPVNGAGVLSETWPVVVGVMFAMMGLSLVAPILPLYAREFGVSRTAAGGLVAAFAVSRLGFDFVGGVIVDRIGTRSVMISGAVILTLSSVAAAMAGSYAVLFVARLLEGAGSAAYTTAAQTWMIKRTPAERLGRTMAWFQTGLLVGIVIGPLVGGYAAQIGDFATPFWIYAAVGVGMVVLSAGMPIESGEPLVRQPQPSGLGLLRRRPFLAIMFVGFALFVMRLGARSTLLPLYSREVLGLSEFEIGTVIAISGVLNLSMVHIAGRSLDKFGRGHIAAAGLVIAGICIAAYGYATSLGAMLIISVVFGVGSSFASLAAPTIVADLADPGREGRAIGMFRAAGDLGAVAGPIGLGAVAEGGSFVAGFWVTAALLIIAAIAAYKLGETAGRRRAESRDDPFAS